MVKVLNDKEFYAQQAVGKLVSGSLYVHTSALAKIPEGYLESIIKAQQITSLNIGVDFNVIRIKDTDKEISLLDYPSFFIEAFPCLQKSWRVSLNEGSISFRDYRQSLNPPILHRKELLITQDHPDIEKFRSITKEAESLGLFENPSIIGFRNNWLELIKSKGYYLSGDSFIPLGNEIQEDSFGYYAEHTVNIERHRTALSRTSLSAPIQSLIRYGLLNTNTTVFDYGCGKGDDLAGLSSQGVNASGWDPYYRPNEPIVNADVVNLGFVINVIEDFSERITALKNSFSITNNVLAVSAMLNNSSTLNSRNYKDGVLSSRGTFQKYYQQAELQQFIESVLDRDAIPVSPGIFFVFKNDISERQFIENRTKNSTRFHRSTLLDWRRRIEIGEKNPKLKRTVKADPEKDSIADALWTKFLELGREPFEDEINNLSIIVDKFGSLNRAKKYVFSRHNIEYLEASAQSRKDDILVMLALDFFSKRRKFRELDKRLQKDIKFFFGGLLAAEQLSQQLLFSLKNISTIENACETASSLGLGYLESRQSLQLHTSMVTRLPSILRVYIGCATVLFGDIENVDLIKIHIQSGKVTLMKFDDFFGKPLPRMLQRIKVRLRDQDMDIFSYGGEYPPPYLFLKSRYINEELPNFTDQTHFESCLKKELKINLDTGYGPSVQELDELLSNYRYVIEGYSLGRGRDIPPIDQKCGANFTFRDFTECSDSWKRTGAENIPKQPESYNALADLAKNILDPLIDYYGSIKLTYGFCSQYLEKVIPRGISSNIDQHASHEKKRTNSLVCKRRGAAVDFLVEHENMKEVLEWIHRNLPYDRIYYYGETRPLHVSYGPDNTREIIELREFNGKRVPIKLNLDKN